MKCNSVQHISTQWSLLVDKKCKVPSIKGEVPSLKGKENRLYQGRGLDLSMDAFFNEGYRPYYICLAILIQL